MVIWDRQLILIMITDELNMNKETVR
jgi:hypothetical protein